MNELKEAFNIDKNGDICHLIRKIASKNYRIGEEVYRDVEEVVQLIETYVARKELEARIYEWINFAFCNEIDEDIKDACDNFIRVRLGGLNTKLDQLSTELTDKEIK